MIHILQRRIIAALSQVSRVLCHRSHGIAPEEIVRSVPERCLDEKIRGHIAAMKVIRLAGAETYHFPADLAPAFRPEMHFARRHVFRLNDVYVHPGTGACRTKDQLFQESCGSLRRCILEDPFPRIQRRQLHLHALTTCIRSIGYYHFLLEEMPRLLWTIETHPDIQVIVVDNAFPFVTQILDELVNAQRIRGYTKVEPGVALLCDDYAFTQAEAYSGFVHSADIALLRELQAAPARHLKGDKRIYASRVGASREFSNERQVESVLTSRGFDIVHAERMSFREQVAIFSSASMVVANHGAGLANVVWCNPGTNVIEIFSPDYFNDCYARLCMTVGLQYQPMWATMTADSVLADINGLLGALDG